MSSEPPLSPPAYSVGSARRSDAAQTVAPSPETHVWSDKDMLWLRIAPVALCSEPGCPVDVGIEGHYCTHHYEHSAADGECGPGCPPPWTPASVVTASRADRQPEPDVMGSSAQEVTDADST